MKNFCGEITYETSEGNVHSDICKHNYDVLPENYRKFLHECLDEWLDNSNNTGAFWVGDPKYFQQED